MTLTGGRRPGASPMAAIELLPDALRRFGALVHEVPAQSWDHPTPCEAWAVHDVVGHVVTEQLWVPYLLGGGTVAAAIGRFDGDRLGDDPPAAWDLASKGSVAAWRRATPDQVVDTSAGPVPAAEYAEQMLLDLVVHGWDLARGAGLDEEADQGHVAHVLEYVRTHADELQRGDGFARPLPPPGTGPLHQLLALLGRRF